MTREERVYIEAKKAGICARMTGKHCFFDRAKLEYSMEYVKKTYTGTVRSVAIGRVHTTPNMLFNIQHKDGAMPPELYLSTTGYLLENTSDGTILYKLSSDSTEAYVVESDL